MSEEDVELVRRSLERFNRGALGAQTSEFDPQIEWHDQRELPGATVHHGLDATVEHLRSVQRILPGYRVDADELVDAGGTVVVSGRVSARGGASDVPVDRPFFAAITIRSGLIRRVAIFASRAEALEAARPPQ